jgi:putative spermidine/putrescine transport system substrate-binding protein
MRRSRMGRSWKRQVGGAGLALVVVSLAFAAAGCGSSKKSGSAVLKSVGDGEGKLSLIAWAGYVEDGSTDPNYDWVTPFEKQTGCQTTVKVAGSSDEMVTLMRTGSYDGVSASGDASLRLVAGGDVAPVNVDLVPNYADVVPALKDQPYNTVDGVHYGIPHGRGANLLMWRTDKVKPAPDSWSVVFDPNSPYKGHITAYDRPIYIADAAVYLKATQPDLNITNPYELDDDQFNAAVDLLKKQRSVGGEYWTDAAKEIQSFTSGGTLLGTSWQYQANTLEASKVPVDAVLPKEGSTGWSDTWMIHSKAKHPNCMYKWMDYVVSPKVQAKIAYWFGEAPANAKACPLITEDKNHCDTFHATDEAYFDQVAEWETPVADCGDDRGDTCKDYSQWTQAWTEIKG